MERLLDIQKGIQGIQGTNDRMETIGHAFFSINPDKLAIQ
jgi:hypothetical protein